MNTEISDSLKGAAREFSDLERRNNLFIQDTLNDFGYQQLIVQAEEVDKALEDISPETEFEDLVLGYMQHNLDANRQRSLRTQRWKRTRI